MARAGLQPERVVNEAALLVDAVGLHNLSLAALAARLGVKTPSLYNHVDGLPALHRALALKSSRLLLEAFHQAMVGRAREDAVRAMAATQRAFIKAHPGLAQAAVRSPSPEDRELTAASDAVMDVCVAALSGFGLTRTQTVHVLRAIRASVHGFASLEMAGGFGLPQDVDESFSWMVETLIAGIPGARPGGPSVVKPA